MDHENARRQMKRHSLTETPQDSSATGNPSKFTFKAYFFLFFAAVGSLSYLALYCKQLGLTAGHVGILNGVRLFTEFIGSPLWGMVGDKFRMRKIILFASLVSYSTGTLLLMSVQPQNQQCIKTEGNKTEITSLIFTAGGTLKLGDDKQEKRFEKHGSPADFTRKVDEAEITKIFIIFLVIICTSQIIGSVVFTMPDALVVGFLKDNVRAFGSFRMWGEVGVAGGSFLVGGVINFYQSEVCGETVKNYFISFYFFAGFSALAIFTVIFMKVSYADAETSSTVTFLPLLKELLKFRNAVIIIVASYLGILDGLHGFGLWYLDDLGAKPYMLGMAAGLRYTIALLAYFASEVLITKFGHVCAIAASLALYVAVYLGLAFVLNPWLGVVLYSVQGFLYGASWVACVVFGGSISLRLGGFYAVTQGK